MRLPWSSRDTGPLRAVLVDHARDLRSWADQLEQLADAMASGGTDLKSVIAGMDVTVRPGMTAAATSLLQSAGGLRTAAREARRLADAIAGGVEAYLQ